MDKTFTVVIPMAGWGTRMRPHTHSKPKPLVSVAGKSTLEHLLDMFQTLPSPDHVEYVFIVGPWLGEIQVPQFIQENYPDLKAHYVVQAEMKGQSHALLLAREFLHGETIVCFSDTLMKTDFSFLANETADAVAWVMPVPDPRRFGVAEVNEEGQVSRFIEKPQSMDNNLVVVGCYYFKSAEQLVASIEEQVERQIMLKNEYFLTDAISVMIEHGANVRTNQIETWLDTGTIEATLDTNKILLDQGSANITTNESNNGTKIIAPSFVHPSSKITNSTIGPYASIGPDCEIIDSRITDSIIEAGCEITSAALSRSLIGRHAKIQGMSDEHFIQLNVGDNSDVAFSETG